MADGRTAHEIYVEGITRAYYQASESFDKLLATLATGALVVSMTFIDKIAASPARSVAWVTRGWGLLAGSLLFSLGSFETSRRALAYRVYEQWDKAKATEHNKKAECWSKWTGRLNFLAAGLLVAGIVGLIGFAHLNLRR